MANVIDTSKGMSETRQMFGRRIITSSAREITKDNVVKVFVEAMNTHSLNRSEIDYLWNYYKGNQPILGRTKDVRPEICNRIVENRANEIVSFKVGYLCGEPIQYIGRNTDESVTKGITILNELMFAEDKASQDQEIIEWSMVSGVAYRLVLPDSGNVDESPFEMYTLDPRNTFVVYSNEIGSKPLMGVMYYSDEKAMIHATIYTDKYYFEIVDEKLIEIQPHSLGMIPIFEYPANNARLGSFEIVLPLLDAINNIDSNRLDGVEQFIQAFWKFVGCKIDKELYQEFLKEGAICIPPNEMGGNMDVDLVVKELNQVQTQTLKEDCYNAVLTICGMPNRNGGSSTSDTGAAVLLRDGWSLAEARAKDSEHMFKKAEKKMLKLVLQICRTFDSEFDLSLKNIELQFTRRNYENIQSKSQVLVSMLQQDKIHPLLAFQHCGLFVDPEGAYTMSKEHFDELQAEREQTIDNKGDEPEDISE